MQKFNIWHTRNFTFAENRDPTLEPAGRESHQLLSSLNQKTLLPYLPNSVYQETFSVKSSGERDDHGSQNAYHTSFSAQEGSGDLNASEVHTNRKFYTWCIPDAYNTCTWVCVYIYIQYKTTFIPCCSACIRETEKQLAEMAQRTPKPMRTPSAAALKHGHSNVSEHFQVITWRSCLMYEPIQQIN